MKDTSPAIERRYRAMMMARSGAERMEMGFDMFDDALRMMEVGLRADHPDASDAEMRRLILFRLYGDELPARWLEKAAKACTWQPRTSPKH